MSCHGFLLVLEECCPGACRPCVPASSLATRTSAPTQQEDSQKKAWDILRGGANARNFDKRANAIQALGLTSGDAKAVQLAENALQDNEANVRTAAAKL